VVDGSHVELFLELVVHNQSLHNLQKDFIGKGLYLFLLLNVDGFGRAECQWLLIQFVDDFFKIVDVGLVDKNDFAVFEVFELLSEAMGT
jgi:hypothetical protein